MDLHDMWDELKLYKLRVRAEVRKELREKEAELFASRVLEKETEFANALIEAPLTVTDKQKILGTRTWSVYKHYLNIAGKEVRSPRVKEEVPEAPQFELLSYSVKEFWVKVRNVADEIDQKWDAVYFGGLTFLLTPSDTMDDPVGIDEWLQVEHPGVWKEFNDAIENG